MGRRDEYEEDLGDEAMDYADMQEDYEHDEYGRKSTKPNNDLANLKAADRHNPNDHREKNLQACMGCNLVMADNQWKNQDCPNCGDEEVGITPQFSGLISVFMPSSSWVARWNKLENLKPGIYAITILEDDPIDQEHDAEEEGTIKKTQKKAKKKDGLYSDDDEEYYNINK